MERKAVESSRK